MVTNVTLNGRISDQELKLKPKTPLVLNQWKQSEIILVQLYSCKIIFKSSIKLISEVLFASIVKGWVLIYYNHLW